jgi:hypothetical protein
VRAPSTDVIRALAHAITLRCDRLSGSIQRQRGRCSDASCPAWIDVVLARPACAAKSAQLIRRS